MKIIKKILVVAFIAMVVLVASNSVALNSKSLIFKSKLENSPPEIPTISGLTTGLPGVVYEYTFNTTDPDGDDIYYWVLWGGCPGQEWLGPYPSGQEIKLNHSFPQKGTYPVQAKAKDVFDAESDWAILNVTIPRAKTLNAPLIIRFIEMFPNAFAILKRLIL